MLWERVSARPLPSIYSSTPGHRHYDPVECDAPIRQSTGLLTRTDDVLLRYRSLAETPLERVEALFPSPLTVVLLRHPVEKLISRIYYNCLIRSTHCNDENVARVSLPPRYLPDAVGYGDHNHAS